MSKKLQHIILLIAGLFLLNYVSQGFYQRFDLTQDQRYTLSDVTINIMDKLENPLSINVYLEGDFPSEFKRLQVETRQYLEELRAKNSNIRFQFINPDRQKERLAKLGMFPSQLTVEENGKLSNALIFPWAEVIYGNKKELVSLLPDGVVQSQEQN